MSRNGSASIGAGQGWVGVEGAGPRLMDTLEARVLLAADPITPDNPLWAVPRGSAVIDGVLDEAAWDSAFTTVRTLPYRADSRATVRVMYDDTAIFVSAEVRDAQLWADGNGGGAGNRWEIETDDSLTVYFDPNNSREEYFQATDRAFAVSIGNPDEPVNGSGAVRRYKYVQGDGAGGAPDVNPGGTFDGLALYRTVRTGTVNNSADVDTGWTMELCVTWAGIGLGAPPVHGQTIGMNFAIIFDDSGGTRDLSDYRSTSQRFTTPSIVDDYIEGVHSSYTTSLAGVRGPVNYAEVMFVDSRAGTAPAPITNLQATQVRPYSTVLTFTAPAAVSNASDESRAGHVSRYEVRYARTRITDESSWLAATAVANTYTPRLRGQDESIRVTGLTPQTTYFVTVRAVDAAGNLAPIGNVVTFATPAASGTAAQTGRVVPSPNGSYLIYENGQPFVVVGDHLGMTWGYTRQLFPGDIWDNANGIYQNFSNPNQVPSEGPYAQYFDLLQARGITTMRVYLELQNVYYTGNPNPPRGLNWLEWNVGQYNPDMRSFMHNVLREAGTRGIRIIFSPFDSFSYDEAFQYEGPWGSNFGGPLTGGPGDPSGDAESNVGIDRFFQEPGTLEIAKARMAQIITWANQSAYADYIIGWEPLSEWESFEWTLNSVDGAPRPNSNPADLNFGREDEFRRRAIWINDLAGYIRQQDPGRPVLMSTIGRDPRGPVARAVFYSRNFDILTPHLYTIGNSDSINNPAADKKVLPAQEQAQLTAYWLTHRIDQRPVLNGEWGLASTFWPGGSAFYGTASGGRSFTLAEDEAQFRTVLWSGFAAGQVGSGLRIVGPELLANAFLLTDPMRQSQLTFSRFIASTGVRVDTASMAGQTLSGHISAASAAGKGLLAWGVSDGTQGFAYVLQDGNRSTGTVTDGVLTITGLRRDSVFDVEIWSTAAGASAPLTTLSALHSSRGDLAITLPAFAEDVAIKFKARPDVRLLQTVSSVNATAGGVGSYLVNVVLGVDRQPTAYVVDGFSGAPSTLDIAALANFRGRAVDVEAFVSADGKLNVALIDDRHHVWVLTGTLFANDWTATDVTVESGAGGSSGELTVFIPSWQTVHLAALDSRGNVMGHFRAPGVRWSFDDITSSLGFPSLDGGLTSWVTPWDALNIAGLKNGEVIAYWFVPGFNDNRWLLQNMTLDFNGPRLTGQLDAFVTSWNAMNLLGLDSSGNVQAYWWVPSTNQWNVVNLSGESGTTGWSAGTDFALSTDNGINIYGLDDDGDLSMIRWLPTDPFWRSSNVAEAAGVRSVFPVGAAGGGNRVVVASPGKPDGDRNLVIFTFLQTPGTWSATTPGVFTVV